MADISSIDAINLAALGKTTGFITQMTKVIDGYKAEDEKLAESQGDLRQKLHEVDSQRERLKLVLNAAESSKQVLQAGAENLRRLCPPIRYLPTEILLYIFRLAVGGCLDLEKKSGDVVTFDPTPVMISHVCSKWRSLAHRSTDLWSTILVEPEKVSTSEATDSNRATTRVAMWRSIGKQKAQSVFVNFWGGKNGFHRIKEALGSSSEPWKAIRIDLLWPGYIPPMEWDVRAVCADHVAVYQYGRNQNLDFLMPLLRYATILTVHGPVHWGSTPWLSLRSLSMRAVLPGSFWVTPSMNFSNPSFRELLQAIPSLISLELDFAVEHPLGADEVVHEIFHSSLCHLALRMTHFADGYGPFGVRLVTPSFQTLKILQIDFNDEDAVATPVYNMEFSKKLSLCRLEEGDISHALALIQQLPNLEDVELEGPHVNDVFIHINSAYSTTASPDSVLPFSKVTRLLMDGTDIEGEALVGHLELRLKLIEMGVVGVYPVTEVKLYENKGVTPGDWTRINFLLDKGREVMVA
ncbi:hypothetical protein M408DRAFT_28122 [Serendipita vermifera MAFF 305830]|uniref:Uncharacterized protein n=1 Tax=Serendipita vermifera MAFF 305830 TaxID=933852 RepID=A0A0C3AEZ5_SERVB|nr:hypothetical protein M408DRAFT_28122 [Serendipita vermifera MAFF 305830]